MNLRPIIYLDNHLISRANHGGWLQDLMLNSLDVVFAFSAINYIEAMPALGLDSATMGRSRRQLELISGCKSKVFFKQVSEILKIKSGDEIKFDDILCDEGSIFGEIGEIFEGKERSQVLYEHVTSSDAFKMLPRADRRRVEKDIKSKGIITDENLLFRMKFLQDEVRRNLSWKFPALAPLFDKGGMFDWMAGEVSDKEFSYTLKSIVLRPEVFCFIKTGDADIDDNVVNLRRMLSSQMDKSISKIRELYLSFHEIRSNPVFVLKDFRKLIGSIPAMVLRDVMERHGIDQSRRAIIEIIIDVLVKKIDEDITKIHNLSSVDQLKRNDFFDALQAPYSRFVDVFCCDGGTKAILEKRGDLQTRLCKNDKELQAAIASFVVA